MTNAERLEIACRFQRHLQVYREANPDWTMADQVEAFSQHALWRLAGGRINPDGPNVEADRVLNDVLLLIAGYTQPVILIDPACGYYTWGMVNAARYEHLNIYLPQDLPRITFPAEAERLFTQIETAAVTRHAFGIGGRSECYLFLQDGYQPPAEWGAWLWWQPWEVGPLMFNLFWIVFDELACEQVGAPWPLELEDEVDRWCAQLNKEARCTSAYEKRLIVRSRL